MNTVRSRKNILKQTVILSGICSCLLLLFPELRAQAPVVIPETENSLNRIDSLTCLLLENIPNHDAFRCENQWYEQLNASSYREDMLLLGSAIPLDYNNFVKQQLYSLNAAAPAYFDRLHQRKLLYFPIFEQVLDRYNLPQELKYVSIIESSLNPNAVSWCGATGLWQFMPYTGKMYEMRIDQYVDERKSIIQSTEKACEFFKSSYELFGDWLLAIASYNCGPGNVKKAIARSGGKTTFWEIKPFLPKETQNYIPRFLAMAYVMNFTHLGDDSQNGRSLLTARVQVDSLIHLEHIASVLEVPVQDVKAYNEHYIKQVVPQSGKNEIILPYHLAMAYLEREQEIFTYAREQIAIAKAAEPVYEKQTSTVYHKVRKGETVYTIAKKHKVTVAQLRSWNKLGKAPLKAGKTLIIKKTTWVKVSPDFTAP
jgi:membrane-bound lytic murein transglycosylase D